MDGYLETRREPHSRPDTHVLGAARLQPESPCGGPRPGRAGAVVRACPPLGFRALHAQAPKPPRTYASDWGNFLRFSRRYGLSPCASLLGRRGDLHRRKRRIFPEVPYKYFSPEVALGLKSASLTRAIGRSAPCTPGSTFRVQTNPDVKHPRSTPRGRSSKTPKAPLTLGPIERALAGYDDSPRDQRTAAQLAIGFHRSYTAPFGSRPGQQEVDCKCYPPCPCVVSSDGTPHPSQH